MKICVMASYLRTPPVGGRDVSLNRITKGIAEKYPDFEFHVISKRASVKYSRDGNVHFYRVYDWKSGVVRFIRELDGRVGFDLIHAFDIYPDGNAAMIASALTKKPLILGVRGTSFLRMYKTRAFEKVIRKADALVFVNECHMGIFGKREGLKDKLLTIRNSISVRDLPGRTSAGGCFTIGNVSYMGDARNIKGWKYLLEAFAKFSDEVPSSRLVLVGCNCMDEAGRMQTAVRSKGLGDKVTLIGIVGRESVMETMRGLDVYVSPAYFEGMPNAVLEAMSMGKPVIAAEILGIRSIIDDGEDGILVRPFSSEEIYEKLMYLHRNPAEARRIGNSAYGKVKGRYDPARELEEWHGLYEKTAGRHGSR